MSSPNRPHEDESVGATTSSMPIKSDELRMKVLSRRSLLWSAAYLGGLYGALRWVNTRPEASGVISPYRSGLEFNEKVWEALYSKDRAVPTFNKSEVTAERANGTFGLDDDFDPSAWKLVVEGVHGHTAPVELTMKTLLAMPTTEMTTEFFCIEGWSIIQTWKGVAMRDFMKAYPPKTRSGATPDLQNGVRDLVPYVAMSTPDDGYYVGLDMPSVIHTQTMLCYSMNGKPLAPEHGAPLRLVIPVKYGVKNIKRIGKIQFTSERPKDYWAEQGYDWFAGV